MSLAWNCGHDLWTSNGRRGCTKDLALHSTFAREHKGGRSWRTRGPNHLKKERADDDASPNFKPPSPPICTSPSNLRHSHSRSRLRVVAATFTSDGQERFRNKELHKGHFEYHRGGKRRPARPMPVENSDVIMFQGFNWESHKHTQVWWKFFQTKVEELVELGVTDVWLPPASQSVDKQGYLPGQLYNLDASSYGKGAELRALIDALHERGICVIGDVVINHRTAEKQDPSGHWNVFNGGVTDKRLAWGAWAVVDDDTYDGGGKGKHDTGESYAAAPDLDHTNKRVEDELTDWMNWLRAEVGFDGWRFDYAKGYGAQYCALYCERTSPSFAVGEVWTTMSYMGGVPGANQDIHRQKLCDWVDGTGGRVSVFDFTTKGILQAAVKGELWRLEDTNGKSPGLIGPAFMYQSSHRPKDMIEYVMLQTNTLFTLVPRDWTSPSSPPPPRGWWPQKAVTFLDNHDTGSTQRHWCFPYENLAMGYAYILTHPGVPCIFYDHYFDAKLKPQIKELVGVRKRNGINAESKLTIELAEDDIYIATIADRLILKLGARMEMGKLLPEDKDWKLAASGENYAVWESKEPPPKPQRAIVKKICGMPSCKDPRDRAPPLEPTHHVHLNVGKMSKATQSRILKEIPDLVDPSTDSAEDNPPPNGGH